MFDAVERDAPFLRIEEPAAATGTPSICPRPTARPAPAPRPVRHSAKIRSAPRGRAARDSGKSRFRSDGAPGRRGQRAADAAGAFTVGLGGEDFHQPLGRAGRALHVAPESRSTRPPNPRATPHTERTARACRRAHACRPARRSAPAHNTPTMHGTDDEDHHGRQDGAHARAPDRDAERFLHRLAKSRAVGLFMGEGLHRLDRVHRLAGIGARYRRCGPGIARDSCRTRRPNSMIGQRPPKARRRGRARRAWGWSPSSCARLPTAITSLRSAKRCRRPDHRLHQRGVGGQPRQHLAGARHLEETGRECEHMAEHLGAHVGDHALADPGHEIKPRGADAAPITAATAISATK